MKTIIKLVLAFSMLCMIGIGLYAQQLPVLPKLAEPKYTEVKYSADTYSYKWEGDDKILVLSGNVKFTQGDTTILADKVEFHEKTRIATTSGAIKIFDAQNSITGSQCNVNFKDKKATISGAVQIVVKPKPKSDKPETTTKKEFLKDELNASCESVDYFYKDKKAVIPSKVTITQKTRTITADSANYNGKDEILELIGNVKGHDDQDKNILNAPKVRISLKKDNEWIQAEKATGTLYIKEEE